MKELLYGSYAVHLYLPFSSLSFAWRRLSNRIRRKKANFLQQVHLPSVDWREYARTAFPKIWEHERANGNVRMSELAVLAALAQGCRPSSNIFEIGTFDGRTTLNFALNAPSSCQIYTLDLPPDQIPKYPLADGERHMVDKPTSGARFERYRKGNPHAIGRVRQLFGDSAAFDYTPYENSCSLVFVDGSHSYEYALSDTIAARNMVETGGLIVWHDYGIWPGVTQALEEIEGREQIGLRNVGGTSLVVWRKS